MLTAYILRAQIAGDLACLPGGCSMLVFSTRAMTEGCPSIVFQGRSGCVVADIQLVRCVGGLDESRIHTRPSRRASGSLWDNSVIIFSIITVGWDIGRLRFVTLVITIIVSLLFI